MQHEQLKRWQHSHSFGQDLKRPGESRTLLVIALTFVMMLVEIAAGIAFGSMALLADGLHMGSHTVALGINAFAYVYARRHAHSSRYSFGTGKVNTLGGYNGRRTACGVRCDHGFRKHPASDRPRKYRIRSGYWRRCCWAAGKRRECLYSWREPRSWA